MPQNAAQKGAEVSIRVSCPVEVRQLVIDALDLNLWLLQPLANWLARQGGSVLFLVDGVAVVPDMTAFRIAHTPRGDL